MSAIVGAFLEAWAEVRVHRARVVLSLIGVFLAVFAMTVVTAAGEMARQAIVESSERAGGRTTTLSVTAYPADGAPDGGSGAGSPTDKAITAAYAAVVERFAVTYASTVVSSGFDLRLESGDTTFVTVSAVDPEYAVIHRFTADEGRWLVPSDVERLSPAVVVNGAFLDEVGLAGSRPPFTVRLPGEPTVTATVVGVVEREEYNPLLMALPEAVPSLPRQVAQGASRSLELWVPPQQGDPLLAAIPSTLAGFDLTGEVYPMNDPGLLTVITGLQRAVRALSLFALALGALGVLNVGIVTVRQRVREIGVRRALGASSSRVFAAVMLESVCATALAGALGVAAAVAVVVNVPPEFIVERLGVSEVPSFPVSAAVEAFVAATVVGALVGLVPATMAARAKVIDAIRY